MNLDFGILWIEDSFSEAEEENLKRRVREAGFIARIDNIPNSQGIERYAREHSLYHCYDIILLDYRLQDNESGSAIAPRIRELFPSTTILFYSGSVDEDQLRSLMAENCVEGVYCSARRRFIERTGSLIEQTARSLDRLSGMRGLAMRVVAECDDIMKEAVIALSASDPDSPKRLGELDSDVFEFMKSMKLAYEAALSGGIQGRLTSRAVDSAKLYNHFRRLTKVVTKSPTEFGLDDGEIDRIRELRKETADYVKNVLQRRNTLGHVVEVQGEDGWVLSGSSEINVGDFPDIRRLFALNIDALREMSSILLSKKP
jgi:CheY-like chemotaxis protein